MEVKKNDKYKKRYILKQIQGKWGYSDFGGDNVLVKNCILNEKYNKIYQVIFNGGETIDGLYLINSFDIDIVYNDNEEKFYHITNKKYDKIAGCDDFNIHAFKDRNSLIDWLIKNEFLSESDRVFINNKYAIKENIDTLQRFVLEG